MAIMLHCSKNYRLNYRLHRWPSHSQSVHAGWGHSTNHWHKYVLINVVNISSRCFSSSFCSRYFVTLGTTFWAALAAINISLVALTGFLNTWELASTRGGGDGGEVMTLTSPLTTWAQLGWSPTAGLAMLFAKILITDVHCLAALPTNCQISPSSFMIRKGAATFQPSRPTSLSKFRLYSLEAFWKCALVNQVFHRFAQPMNLPDVSLVGLSACPQHPDPLTNWS